MAPPVTEEVARKKNVQFHPRVQTANCHRLKICGEHECSKKVLHRDGSAAGNINFKQWFRLALGNPNRRYLVEYLLTDDEKWNARIVPTPHFMDRGRDRTEKPTPPRKSPPK
jgi:hypothetical protein